MLRVCFVLFFFGLMSCHPTKNSTIQNHLLFSMEKGPCFGTCPEYKIEVFSSGEARFSGIRNVQHIGQFQTKLSPALIQEITSTINDLNVLALDTNYVNKYLTDFPATDIRFEINGVNKHIHVCHESPPQEIQKVLDLLSGFENRIQWDFTNQSNQH